MIISTKRNDGTYTYQHLNLKINENKNNNRDIKETVYRMDKNNNPLTVMEINGNPIIRIHYGDSVLIKNIRWIPFVEFGFAFIVLVFMFLGINLIWSNEKNSVYIGMAKETAHQLGTPISSLMGWVGLLEENPNDKNKIYDSMKNDLKKLENISDRFNKIGSLPKFIEFNLVDVMLDVIEYYKSKLPKSSKTVIDYNFSKDNLTIKGDRILLSWAFENIIKNSIDSIKSDNGKIFVDIKQDNEKVIILFIDNGSGISRDNKGQIFKPGFSTKNKGWGIGLNLTKRIIEYIHKGKIKLNKSDQYQTVFEINLYLSIS
jgi:signal transduction histidine kinase